MNDASTSEFAHLTDDERVVLRYVDANLRGAQGGAVTTVRVKAGDFTTVEHYVERIVHERLVAFAERERPVLAIEGVPQALRVAAMLPAETLGRAWDENEFVIGTTPPWSYLRRFLNALAGATEVASRPVPAEPKPDPVILTKSSGGVVDLLGALQRSVDAAKADREMRTPPGLAGEL